MIFMSCSNSGCMIHALYSCDNIYLHFPGDFLFVSLLESFSFKFLICMSPKIFSAKFQNSLIKKKCALASLQSDMTKIVLSYDVTFIQWITSCHK